MIISGAKATVLTASYPVSMKFVHMKPSRAEVLKVKDTSSATTFAYGKPLVSHRADSYSKA